jgi:hypothetical protein
LDHDSAPPHTSFFTSEFLTKNNMTVVPTHPTFLFLRLRIQPKGRHFDTIKLIEENSQAALNTLTEQGFQDAFKIGRSAGNCTYSRKGTASIVIVANRLKVSV